VSDPVDTPRLLDRPAHRLTAAAALPLASETPQPQQSKTMATIDIKRAHILDLAEAKTRAEALAKSMQEKLGIRWNWEGDNIKFDARVAPPRARRAL
jgi:hypothetical protein